MSRPRRSCRSAVFRRSLAAEVLEDRTLLTAYVVDTLADTVAADGHVSLREAILAANTNAAFADAAAGQGGGVTDTISFAPAVAGGTVELGGSQLTVIDHLLIAGPVAVDGNGLSRVFGVGGAAAVAMAGLTITGGAVLGSGAGVVVIDNARLTLTNCVLAGNVALKGEVGQGITGTGAAVANVRGAVTLAGCLVTDNTGGAAVNHVEGQLTVAGSVVAGNDGGVWGTSPFEVRDSAVRDNRGRGVASGSTVAVVRSSVTGNAVGGIVAALGGSVIGCTVAGNAGTGVWVSGRGPLVVSDSTVSGNSAVGIVAQGVLSVLNSTISGNRGPLGAGGIAMISGTATLRNATVFGNRADGTVLSADPAAGGITAGSTVSSATVTLHNTIVAGNVRGRPDSGRASDLYAHPGDPSPFGYPASAFAGGHDLIGDAGTAGGFAGGANGNVVGIDWRLVLDGVLRDNGGPAPTHRLWPNGPAVDAGSDAEALGVSGPLVYDQRGSGRPRVRQARVDIGSYEAGPADDLVEYSTFAGGEWWVRTRGGPGFTSSVWADWPNASWAALAAGDFDGDRKADALGLNEGAWFVGLGTGASFGFARWGVWSDAAWGHVLVGDLDGDGRDDVLAEVGGEWWGALSTGNGFGAPAKWAGTSDAAWELAALADMTGDGREDLALFARGEWYVAASGGAAAGLGPARLWARWADAAWRVRLGDFNADGLTDVVGLLRGEWYLGGGTGAGFTTVLRARWADAAWADPVVGDFDGDGRDDVAARLAGEWWVGLSDALGYERSRAKWAAWRDVEWRDVLVGDFDGDGRDDVAAGAVDEWYVARSTGSAFETEYAGRLAGRRAAFAADATGPPAGHAAAGSFAPVAAFDADESLALFWSQADRDEAFAGGLLAAG